ncbi:hypothetical protein SCLCIDRAFT_893675 [Scleroderma citrinum Foug A]|uniref:Uncharacterized protein n=1 Tax=Scleroderma citrinum Foug A TaxID=1036808 RepID=A0A0C3AUW4_9AGAM|nr:hypothetical protein SCLCIDRAFT_893675 [Scleroderma citrinum Foug A]
MIPRLPWEDSAEHNYNEMLVRSPEHAQHINKARSGAKCSDGQICIMQTRLPQTTRLLQISSVMRKSSRTCVVKLELFHNPGFGDISGEWITFGVIEIDFPGRDWRGFMMLDRPRKFRNFEIDGVPGNFWATPDGIKLGDYGHFMGPEEFSCERNLFSDLESLALMADITPR